MKICKIVAPVLLITALVGSSFVVSDASAAPRERANYNCGMITPEQRTEVDKIMMNALSKVKPIRDELYVKKQELIALQNAANPEVDKVSKTATEITKLRGQLEEERKALGVALDKALGLPEGTHGYGRGGYNCMGGNPHKRDGNGRGMQGKCPF